MTSAFSDTSAEWVVLQTLLYFELFAYPLTKEEVFHFCADPDMTLKDVSEKLQVLEEQGFVFHYDNFFQTKKEPSWAKDRRENNQRAVQMLPTARRMAAFIQAFPYVRAVFVSGSLSKQSMRPDSDIDFFVITAPGRLWFCRTMLVAFKKLLLFNSHKYFCVNYFIDTDHPEIEEKNLFTATETVTLLPMQGRAFYEQFRQSNNWAWKRFPHVEVRPAGDVPPYSANGLKRLFEWLFSGKAGHWLDNQAMQLTVNYWKRKFRHIDQTTFGTALKSRKYVSKHHPLHFQGRVLEGFERRKKEFFQDQANPAVENSRG